MSTPTTLPQARAPASVEIITITLVLVLGVIAIFIYIVLAYYFVYCRCFRKRKGVVLYLHMGHQKAYSEATSNHLRCVFCACYKRSKCRRLSMPNAKYVMFNRSEDSNLKERFPSKPSTDDEGAMNLKSIQAELADEPSEIEEVGFPSISIVEASVEQSSRCVDGFSSLSSEVVGNAACLTAPLPAVVQDAHLGNSCPGSELAAGTDSLSVDSVSDFKPFNTGCAICIQDFCHSEKVLMLDCRHAYHDFCIARSMLENPSCPLCMKAHIVKEPKKTYDPLQMSGQRPRANDVFLFVSHQNV